MVRLIGVNALAALAKGGITMILKIALGIILFFILPVIYSCLKASGDFSREDEKEDG